MGLPTGEKSGASVWARTARLPAPPSVHITSQRPSASPAISGAIASPPGPPRGRAHTVVVAGTAPDGETSA